ncbi:MAG: YCF48-related protein [Candidatus Kapaibacterium sp.]
MRLSAFYTLLFVLVTSGASAQTWRRLIDAPTYGLAANPQNPNTIIVGGLGRTIYRTEDGGKTWATHYIEFQSSGNTKLTNIYIHARDTNIVLAGGAFQYIMRSDDGGLNWHDSFGQNNKPVFATPGETLVADPHNPDIVYAGDNNSNRIFKTRDAGLTWDTVAKLDVPTLCTIAVRPDSGNILLAGASTGIIVKSVDSGKTWRQTAQLRNFQDVEVPRIVFSRHDPRIAYLIIAYFNYKNRPSGGVYKTTDGGENWFATGLQDTSFWTVATRTFGADDEVFVGGFTDELSQDPKTMIAGPGLVRRSQNGGNSWVGVDKAIDWLPIETNKNIWMMKFIGTTPATEKLYMATEMGFFVLDAPSDVTENPSEMPGADISASIAHGVLRMRIPPDYIRTPQYEVEVYDLSGRKVFETSAYYSVREFTLPAIAKGAYCCQISSGDIKKSVVVVNE